MPIGLAARHLRVPVGWLRGEADAGRIPHLRAGRVILVDLELIRSVLLKRAQGGLEGDHAADNGE